MALSKVDKERFARLRLIRSENVGPIAFRQLLQRYKTATNALTKVAQLAQRGGKRRLKVCPLNVAQKEWEQLHDFGGFFTIIGDAHYPELLLQISDAPPVLSCFGHKDVLQSKKTLSIVGGRNASTLGRNMAYNFAKTLANNDYCIISGLAHGIDAAAHKGALDAENGTTIGVIASGIDEVYPSDHLALFKQVATMGLLVTEVPFGVKPQRQYFPRRNRIISGLSKGTLIVEATLKSGSLITANQAAQQGREVFALPGSPADPRAKGTNRLIKDGAILTQGPQDIIDVLEANIAGPHLEQEEASFSTQDTNFNDTTIAKLREGILDSLSPTPIDANLLIRELNCPIGAFMAACLELELAGQIERYAGHKIGLHIQQQSEIFELL